MKLEKIIFPFTYSLNMFSMTALLILSGAVNQLSVAADLAIVHASTLIVFMAFSTNARNIILSESLDVSFQQLLIFRLIFVLPLAFFAYQLSMGVISLSKEIVFLLVLRKSIEWVLELRISKKEVQKDYRFAYFFSAIQLICLLILSITLILGDMYYFKIMLSIWAISPIFLVGNLLSCVFSEQINYKINFKAFLPHIGSSWIIACATYMFRVLLVLLAGKTTAGLMFSAYAIGGVASSIYVYAFGPTIVANLSNNKQESKFTLYTVLALCISGILFYLITMLFGWVNTSEDNIYFSTIAWSLIGGGVMLLAQRKRIQIIQNDKDSVFVPDVIINIILISIIPFAFFILGIESLTMLFLFNAILTYVIFIFPNFYKKDIKSQITSRLLSYDQINRVNIQTICLFFLFLPLFFHLGNGWIFNDIALDYASEGSLSKLPLPFSLAACFLGIFVLAKFKECQISALVLFSFFTLMFVSSMMNTINNNINLTKILMLIQYILPVFGLLLGQAYKPPKDFRYSYEAIALYVLLFIIPLQVVCTIIQGTGLLTPYIYVFSIYQHLQYTPVIFVGFYSLALILFSKDKVMQFLLLSLMPIVVMYVVFSNSSSAFLMSLLLVAAVCFLMVVKRKYEILFFSLFFIILALTLSISLLNNHPGKYVQQKYDVAQHVESLERDAQLELDEIKSKDESLSFVQYMPKNIRDRYEIWSMYWDRFADNPQTILFGNEKTIDRNIYASAHNYYLDILYNFGLLSLMPLIILVLFTLFKIYSHRTSFFTNYGLVSLFFVVFYYVLIDNSFKVAFKQPYPGIIMFFLWGVLLSRLSNRKEELNL